MGDKTSLGGKREWFEWASNRATFQCLDPVGSSASNFYFGVTGKQWTCHSQMEVMGCRFHTKLLLSRVLEILPVIRNIVPASV